ncbi:MAG: hypothetical protein IMZ69_12215, partial [Spirochaetes bacterium]|nr:hypothetical protein [Spirochaetota bacterium]
METDVIFPQKGHFADDGLIIVLPLSIARDALLSQLNNYIKGGKVQA